MQAFLDRIVEQVNAKYKEKIGEVTVVFPNRRAGAFFKNYMARSVRQPLFSPQVLTFEEFIMRLSPLKCADKLTLVHTLYEVFREVSGVHESFDRFFAWGEMLLHDFDEIDKWQVDARDLFTNIKDIKEIETHFNYLTPEQIEVIARFWKSFEYTSSSHASFSGSRERFISLWSKLFSVYDAYRERLRNAGIAYEGMLTREAAALADQHLLESPFTALVFVGFHDFSRSEEKVVEWFIREEGADIYWDVDALYVGDNQQEAGTFFRKYRSHKTFSSTFDEVLPAHFTRGTEKKMQLIATTLEVGQAKKLGEMLADISAQPDFSSEKTVIVLPEEHLLFPVLHSLPESIRRVNVTMGYPLRKTPLYSLLEDLLTLQEEKKYNEEKNCFSYHYTAVLSILKHPYLVQYHPEVSFENVQKIARYNKVFIRAEDLKGDHELYPVIFQPIEEVHDMFDYLREILTRISELVREDNKITDEDSGEEIALPNLEQELIYHFYIQLNRLKSIAEEQHLHLTWPVFMRLFRQVLQSVRVPFTGEPLRGLQIMGVLETRNLDFENVFILSVNEGVFPPADVGNSFIPASLRKGFGLPIQDYQDARYAYTFFRLLQKAKNIYCFYNTEDMPQLSGEPSRFLYQLMYESDRLPDGRLRFPRQNGKVMIRQNTLAMPVHAIPAPDISINKCEEVKKSMAHFLTKGNKHTLTPSALNTYLDCRLKFYFKYVAGMGEAETMQAEVDPLIFGNILHRAMEEVYQNYMHEQKTNIIGSDISQLLKGKPLEKAVSVAFREHFRIEEDQHFNFEGKNLIAREIIMKMCRRILDLDAEYAPFEILGLEQKDYYLNLPVQHERGAQWVVPLRGIIDRIDRKDGVVRVLDYKTGRDEKNIRDMASIFDRQDPRRSKGAMQAMFYALLYNENQEKPERIIPGLINAKNIFEEPFDPGFTIEKNYVGDFALYKENFVQHLSALLAEIFDESVPFGQTDDRNKCSYCPYAGICF